MRFRVSCRLASQYHALQLTERIAEIAATHAEPTKVQQSPYVASHHRTFGSGKRRMPGGELSKDTRHTEDCESGVRDLSGRGHTLRTHARLDRAPSGRDGRRRRPALCTFAIT